MRKTVRTWPTCARTRRTRAASSSPWSWPHGSKLCIGEAGSVGGRLKRWRQRPALERRQAAALLRRRGGQPALGIGAGEEDPGWDGEVAGRHVAQRLAHVRKPDGARHLAARGGRGRRAGDSAG